MTGTVKWFDNKKGYGFITSDEGGEDIFFHFSSIIADGYKTVADGQKVSFETKTEANGKLRATDVTAL